MLKRPLLGLPKHEDGAGRAPYLFALAIQFALLLVLSTVLSVPVFYIFRSDTTQQRDEQRITFMKVPPSPNRPRVPPREPAPPSQTAVPAQVARPVVQPPVAPPVVQPPVEIPAGIVAPPTARPDTIDRRIVGRGGLPGLTAGVVDPRLLGITPPGPVADGPVRLTPQSSDSAVRSWVRAYWDSIAFAQANAPKRNPQDWTFDRNGDKYGLDPQWIYFGKYRLPTMLLALLPINAQANPTAWQRNRQLESMRQDIMFQAMRAANKDDFNAAVKLLRARKEAEHQADMAKKAAAASGVKPPDGRRPH